MNVYIGISSRGCSVSLISNQTAVAAASCLLDKKGKLKQDPNQLYIFIGIETTKYGCGIHYSARKVYYNPEFSPESLKNDIAIIELDSPVLKDIFTSVAIYSGNETDDMNLVTAGWGFTLAGLSGISSNNLNTAKQSPSSSSVCKDANIIWPDNNKKLVCTLVTDGKGSAYDDSGSPLKYMNNGTNLLVGVASNTGKSGSDAIILPEDTKTNYYTHVYSYIDWTVNITGLERPYLLNTTARPSPDYSTITGVLTNGNFSGPDSTSTTLQNTGFILVIFLSLVLVLLF